MPIGSLDKGRTLDMPVADGIESGAPVMTAGLVGVALTDADAALPGNTTGDHYATIAFDGEWAVPVAGSPAVGSTVFATGSLTAGEAVAATLTAVEGTTGKRVFGVVTGIVASGVALVAIAGVSTSTGASA